MTSSSQLLGLQRGRPGVRHTVSVLLNNGDATFASESVYEVGFRQQDVRIGDIDGDAVADLIAIRGSEDGFADPNVHVPC